LKYKSYSLNQSNLKIVNFANLHLNWKFNLQLSFLHGYIFILYQNLEKSFSFTFWILSKVQYWEWNLLVCMSIYPKVWTQVCLFFQGMRFIYNNKMPLKNLKILQLTPHFYYNKYHCLIVYNSPKWRFCCTFQSNFVFELENLN